MNQKRPTLRCAIYTRFSTEHGLEQEFNSLDNQREASEAYVKSQAHEGWRCVPALYDDGGFSGGSMDRRLYSVSLPISGSVGSTSWLSTR
jgi:site-specific DNA recombinase